MNPFSGTSLSNCTFLLLWVAKSKRLLLKTRKTSKGQEEILACTLQNDSSKTGKILGKSLCRSPVLETLSCNFIKQGSTAGILLGDFRLFGVKQFHKTTFERLIGKSVHLLLLQQGNCQSVVGNVLSQETFVGHEDVFKTCAEDVFGKSWV